MVKRKSKRGRAARNARKSNSALEPSELTNAPHCFVINRGLLGKTGTQLMLNFRKIMAPYTASNLRVTKQNVLKDFVHIAGPLNVTHLVAFTKTEISMYMKVIKLPRGPTMTFKIKEFCLIKDILSSLKKTLVYENLFQHHPLLVLNNFSGEGLHYKLMTTMFQGMFPSINVNKARLNAIRRCLLFHYNEDKTIDLRHYSIKLSPCGLSKPIKKIVQSKVPDLGNLVDFSEYVDMVNCSDSEAEMEGALNQVVLPQPVSTRGNIMSNKSAIRLYELGPRLKLQLIKIEEGIASGDVLFHEYISKTPEEVAAMKAKIQKEMQLKAQRKAIQEQNVKRKAAEQKGHSENNKDVENENVDEDDDAKWYEAEVGEKPDADLGLSRKRKRTESRDTSTTKKVRFQHGKKNEGKETKGRKNESKESKKSMNMQEFLERRKKKKQAKLKKKKRAMRKKKRK